MNLIVNGVMEKINRLIVQRSTCIWQKQFMWALTAKPAR